MDIAHAIARLNAHAGVLEAEIARIDSDLGSLRDIQSRYDHSSALTSSTSATTSSLTNLKKHKTKQLGEVRQQLDLFRLHLPSAQQLLERLAATQHVELPPTSFPAPTANVTALVESPILMDHQPHQPSSNFGSRWSAAHHGDTQNHPTSTSAVVVTPFRGPR